MARTTTAETAPPPPAGHNTQALRAPPLTPDELQLWLTAEWRDLIARGEEIQAGIERFLTTYPTIPNDDIMAKATDFTAGKGGAINTYLQSAKRRHEEEKAPWLALGRTVDAFHTRITASIVKGQGDIRARTTAYAVRKDNEARAAAQQAAAAAAAAAEAAAQAALKSMRPKQLDAAEQLAKDAEAAAAAANASSAANSRTYGNLGTVGSLRSTWKFNEAESDILALARAVLEGRAPAHYLAFNETRINFAVRSEKVRDIPGCVIREEKSYV